MQPPALLGLIADPLRWRLLTELGRSDRRVGELVRLVGKPQNLVSYHLGELRDAGVVRARRSAADGRDVYYSADLSGCRDRLRSAGVSLHPALRFDSAPPAGHVARGARRPRVLFLCTGNSARSQIAEALLSHASGGTVAARSAGSHPKPLHPNAVRVMAERGIDIAANKTKPLTRFARMRFDRVITLCDKVREVCPEFPGAAAAHWSIADPAAAAGDEEATYPAFQRVADEIDERVGFLLAELGQRATERSSNHG